MQSLNLTSQSKSIRIMNVETKKAAVFLDVLTVDRRRQSHTWVALAVSASIAGSSQDEYLSLKDDEKCRHILLVNLKNSS